MKTTWYRGERKFKNGITWMRFTGHSPLRGWGFWIADRRSPKYDVGDNSTPWSPLVLLRLPRYTVAILHPSGNNLP